MEIACIVLALVKYKKSSREMASLAKPPAPPLKKANHLVAR